MHTVTLIKFLMFLSLSLAFSFCCAPVYEFVIKRVARKASETMANERGSKNNGLSIVRCCSFRIHPALNHTFI